MLNCFYVEMCINNFILSLKTDNIFYKKRTLPESDKFEDANYGKLFQNVGHSFV